MISVIVPVYKVENYIDKCVRSLLMQTYKDYEVILVDDGSPDKCPLICDRYADENDCVRTLHKTNGGLSDARNYGVAHAKGEFVTFVDSDDFVDIEYLETLYRLLKKNDCDIAVTGIETFLDNTPNIKNDNIKEFVYSKQEALEKMLYQNTLDTSACAMLIPTEIVRSFPFPVGKYHEDEFTTYKYYSSAERVAVTTKKQYFYLQRDGSIMHVFGKSSMDELDAADNLVEYCKQNYSNLVAAAESKKFSDYCQVLLSNPNIKKEYPDVYNRIYLYLKKKSMQILFDKKCRKKNRLAAMLLLISDNLLQIANRFKR